MGIIECVPNFSTSDENIIAKIVEPVKLNKASKLLNVEADPDYNRVVVTFTATSEEVVNIGYEVIAAATRWIDMRTHQGEHPRIGATDVFPLVPLKDATFTECIALAERLGSKVGELLNIPVYLYGKAAMKSNRKMLSNIRKGEYEGLPDKLGDEKWKPDFGPSTFIPKTGICVIGVRNILIAYNVNLDTTNLDIAKKISRKIRASGWSVIKDGIRVRNPGYLKEVQAMGVKLYRGKRNLVQVSTNVLNYRRGDSIHDVFEAVRKEAQDFGTKVTGSEIVGLVPKDCLLAAGRFYSDTELSDKELINVAIDSLGLSDLNPFHPEHKIIEYLL